MSLFEFRDEGLFVEFGIALYLFGFAKSLKLSYCELVKVHGKE